MANHCPIVCSGVWPILTLRYQQAEDAGIAESIGEMACLGIAMLVRSEMEPQR
jgi:hypothetical protein